KDGFAVGREDSSLHGIEIGSDAICGFSLDVCQPEAVAVGVGGGAKKDGLLKRGREISGKVRSRVAPVLKLFSVGVEPRQFAVSGGGPAIDQQIMVHGKIAEVARIVELNVGGDGNCV